MQARQVHVGWRHRRVQPVQNHRDAPNIAGWQPAGVVTFEETLERAASEGPDHSSKVRRWLTESNISVPVRPSDIVLEAEISGREVTGLRIGEYAVRVASGVLES